MAQKRRGYLKYPKMPLLVKGQTNKNLWSLRALYSFQAKRCCFGLVMPGGAEQDASHTRDATDGSCRELGQEGWVVADGTVYCTKVNSSLLQDVEKLTPVIRSLALAKLVDLSLCWPRRVRANPCDKKRTFLIAFLFDQEKNVDKARVSAFEPIG